VKRKFIALDEAEKITLQEGRKNGKAQAFQERCHCLLLSCEGYQVKESAGIFRVSEITVYGWLKRWEISGLVGLKDKPGRGRKPDSQERRLAASQAAGSGKRAALTGCPREIKGRIRARVFC